jgi:hypothetical protein
MQLPLSKENSFNYETNDMLLEGLNRDMSILKGRKLDSLPEVRRALGESAGYLETNWETALANTKLTASVTAQRAVLSNSKNTNV